MSTKAWNSFTTHVAGWPEVGYPLQHAHGTHIIRAYAPHETVKVLISPHPEL